MRNWVAGRNAIHVELQLRPVVSADDMVPLARAEGKPASTLRTAGSVRGMYPAAIGRVHKEDESRWCGRDRDAIEVRRHEALATVIQGIYGRPAHPERDADLVADVQPGIGRNPHVIVDTVEVESLANFAWRRGGTVN